LLGLDAGRNGQERPRPAAFQRLIGAENLRLFARRWNQTGPADPGGPDRARLFDLTLAQPRAEGFPALRQIAHSTWKQLGLPTSQEIPLVLFAWTRDPLDPISEEE